jgi:hypothetical protein
MKMDEKKLLAECLDVYIKEKHTQEECTGFINGFEKAIQQVKNLNIPDVRKRLSEIKNWINESMLERDDVNDGVTNREKNANILLGYALKLCDDDL